jgi:putative flavoprotein involved in K+ transport
MICIVGAGPAGLATAYALQKRGLDYHVLERHTPGATWSNHYDRLHLHTLKQVSALPGLPMPKDYPSFPSASQLHAYLEEYARHFNLNMTSHCEVSKATWGNGVWRIQTSAGEREASTLVAATGIWSTPYIPTFDGQETFTGTLMHASAYRNAEPFKGQRVLVIGGGNSGADIAVELAEQATFVAIAIRNGATFVNPPTSPLAMRLHARLLRILPTFVTETILQHTRRGFSHLGIFPPVTRLIDTYPVVGYRLPKAVDEGNVTVYRGIKRFTSSGVQFQDGILGTFDTIILATGYRPTVQFVAEEIELDDAGRPKVDRAWRSVKNPQLYCVGYWYPTTAGWLQSIGRIAQQVAKSIAKQ